MRFENTAQNLVNNFFFFENWTNQLQLSNQNNQNFWFGSVQTRMPKYEKENLQMGKYLPFASLCFNIRPNLWTQWTERIRCWLPLVSLFKQRFVPNTKWELAVQHWCIKVEIGASENVWDSLAIPRNNFVRSFFEIKNPAC